MSLLQCACTKSRVHESPVTAPYYRDSYKTLGEAYQATAAGSYEEELRDIQIEMVDYEPNASHYELYTIIGKGCNDKTTIHLAKHLPSGTIVSIKRTDLDICDFDFPLLQNEILMCRQIQHEKILPYYSTFVHGNEMWLVMPLYAFGSCKDLVHAFFTTGLNEQAIAYILRDVLQALDYLHNRGVIHRGVKASHILIAANGQVALSGLRMAYSMVRGGKRSKCVFDYPQHTVKCLQWFSPEILDQNLTGYDTKSDVYSVGITACELANGYAPFEDMPVTQMLLEKLSGTKPVLADTTTIADLMSLEESSGIQADSGIENEASTGSPRASTVGYANTRTFSRNFHNFVDLCLEKDPTNRPTASDLLNHPFFKHLRKRTSEALVSLLHPVSPLTDISKLPKDDSSVDMVTRALDEVSMEEEWDF